MGGDGDRFELKPCNQTAALPCYPESRWFWVQNEVMNSRDSVQACISAVWKLG